MAPVAPELVRAAMARLGTDSPTRFAGLVGLGSYQRVRRWLDGENEPDYEATMQILEACGWLNIQTDQQAPMGEGSVGALLRELRGALAELALGQAAIHDELKAAREMREESGARPEDQERPGKGKTG